MNSSLSPPLKKSWMRLCRLKAAALGRQAGPDPLLYISIMSWHVTETIRLLRFYDDVKHLDFVMSRKVLFDDVSRTVYIDWNCSTCDRPLCGSVACMVAILIRERHQYKPQPKKFNFCFHHWWSRLRHEESPHSTYYPSYRHLSITYEEIVFVKWSSVLKIAKNKFC